LCTAAFKPTLLVATAITDAAAVSVSARCRR
jgi:hypothetical protein